MPVSEFGVDFWGQSDVTCADKYGLGVGKESSTTIDGDDEATERANQTVTATL